MADDRQSTIATPPTEPWAAFFHHENFDRTLRANEARLTQGVSPTAMTAAWADWLGLLTRSPGKQISLMQQAWMQSARLGFFAWHAMRNEPAQPVVQHDPNDHRFRNGYWNRWPHNFLAESFLAMQDWWQDAASGMRGMQGRHEEQGSTRAGVMPSRAKVELEKSAKTAQHTKSSSYRHAQSGAWVGECVPHTPLWQISPHPHASSPRLSDPEVWQRRILRRSRPLQPPVIPRATTLSVSTG